MSAWEKWKMRRVVEYNWLNIDPTMAVMTGRLIVGPSTLLNILGLHLFNISLYQFCHIMSNCTIISFPEGERSPTITRVYCLSVTFYCFVFSSLFGLFANVSFSSWRQYWDIFSTEKASQAAFPFSSAFPVFPQLSIFFLNISYKCIVDLTLNAMHWFALTACQRKRRGRDDILQRISPGGSSMQVVWYAIQVW